MNDKPPNDNMPTNVLGQLRSYLARNGFGIAQIIQAVGSRPNGRTRQQVTNDLINWLINNQQGA
jgi:hypothetical protein